MTALVTDAAHGFALVLTLGVIVTAMAALMARSLFAMCMYLAAACALASAALLALEAGESALVWALLGAGLAPFLLMAGILLSARAAVSKRLPWVTIILAVGVTAAIGWAAAWELSAARASLISGASPFWIAALVFVAALAVAALLGYGERGVLESKTRESDA